MSACVVACCRFLSFLFVTLAILHLYEKSGHWRETDHSSHFSTFFRWYCVYDLIKDCLKRKSTMLKTLVHCSTKNPARSSWALFPNWAFLPSTSAEYSYLIERHFFSPGGTSEGTTEWSLADHLCDILAVSLDDVFRGRKEPALTVGRSTSTQLGFSTPHYSHRSFRIQFEVEIRWSGSFLCISYMVEDVSLV